MNSWLPLAHARVCQPSFGGFYPVNGSDWHSDSHAGAKRVAWYLVFLSWFLETGNEIGNIHADGSGCGCTFAPTQHTRTHTHTHTHTHGQALHVRLTAHVSTSLSTRHYNGPLYLHATSYSTRHHDDPLNLHASDHKGSYRT